MWEWDLTVKPSGRKPRSRSARCSETYTRSAEPVETSEQAAVGDYLSHRPVFPGRGLGHKNDDSTDSCVPILARVHHFDTRKLDADIQQEQEFGRVELTTGQGRASEDLPRHEPGRENPRVL